VPAAVTRAAETRHPFSRHFGDANRRKLREFEISGGLSEKKPETVAKKPGSPARLCI
jgi:hypothetical protein